MKLFRTLLFFACALSLNSIFAQNLMNIHQGNGTLIQIPLESIDSVRFITVPPPTIQKIFQSNGNILSVAVSDIDSITYTIPNSAALASISTQAVTVLSSSSAYSGGTISSDGGSTITQRGVCWSTSPNPTLANNFSVDGTGIGSYGSNMAPLQSATTYYVRAYAVNSEGTAYGNQLTFTTSNPSTSGSLATITTANVSYTDGLTASCGGNITADGGLAVTARGVCWASGTTPTINNYITSNGIGGGSFNSSVSNLLPGTSYFVRAYATNDAGTAYGITYGFSTHALPTITTTAISAVSYTSAQAGGSISSNGGSNIVQRGVCYSTSPAPTLNNSVLNSGSGNGSFTINLITLSSNTTYYVRAFATNGVGTAYGNEEVFTTQGSITALNCATATNNGTLTQGVAASSVNSSVPYTGGTGGTYTEQTITSTGVTGLTATLAAGTLLSGAGSLTYNITGTAASSGTASFALSIGGQTCTLTRTVNPPAGTITALSCSTATNTGSLIIGVAAASVSISIPYTGGNGGTYTTQTITSTGVSGLTATLAAGTLLSGAGSLTYNITGTPDSSGTASFALSIGGQTCSLTRSVISGGQTGITAHSCGATNVHNPAKTYGTMTDQEGNVYKTIVIGTQEWMAENLKTSIYRNGQPITNVIDGTQWGGLSTGAWCNYQNNNTSECPYGKLYNWYAVADPRNVCPTGWHVPTDGEWTTLTTFLGGESVAGGKMKSTGIQYWVSPNLSATNESGFSGLPGGNRSGSGSGTDLSGKFYSLYGSGAWWSSSESSTPIAWFRALAYNTGSANPLYYTKQRGLRVRCLRD
jgi:uncharacterized protein (TIGR02145 family)